jgi:hypothetical protein
MSNGVRYFQTIAFTRALDDLYGDELGRTLGIAHDGLGQLQTYAVDRIGEPLIALVILVLDTRGVRFAGGDQYYRVVRRGIAVNGDAIERAFYRLRETGAQRLVTNSCIRCHEGQ